MCLMSGELKFVGFKVRIQTNNVLHTILFVCYHKEFDWFYTKKNIFW